MEKRVQVAAKSDDFKNVPDNLLGIADGDVLCVGSYPDGRKYTEEQKFLRGVQFYANNTLKYRMADAENKAMEFRIHGGISKTAKDVIVKNGYTGDFTESFSVPIFFDMLTFRDKTPGGKAVAKSFKNFSIVNEKKDKAIIKEMIALVDKERIEKTMRIALGRGACPNDGVVDKFLLDWANAKYDIYLMFGKKLSVSTPISYNMDSNEMSSMVYELYKKYPQYAASLDKIIEAGSMEAYTDNKAPACDFFRVYCPDTYKPGMKLSKFFSQCFKDDNFDVAFSKVMQDRLIKGNVVLSVDPYDFITSATNMHGWTSCHRIFDNDGVCGSVFAWCSDPNAIVAFRENGKTYKYDHGISRNFNGQNVSFDFGKNSFEGNSKSWRQIVNIDRNTTSALFGREYPSNKDIEVVADKARELFETVASAYLGIDEWNNYGDLADISKEAYFGAHPVYKDVSRHHYSDPANWTDLLRSYPKIKKSFIAPAGTDMSAVCIEAGGKMTCLHCGKPLSKDSQRATCRDC